MFVMGSLAAEMETSAAFCAGLVDHVCQFDKKKGGQKKYEFDRDFEQLKLEFQSTLGAGAPPVDTKILRRGCS